MRVYARLISLYSYPLRADGGRSENESCFEEGGEGREIDFGTIASIRTNTQGVAEKEREREARRVNFDVLSDPFEIAVTNPCRRGPRFAYG